MSTDERSGWLVKLNAIFEILVSDQDPELLSYQLEETRTTFPVLPAFHFFASVTLLLLCWGHVPGLQLALWSLASIGLFLTFTASYFLLARAPGHAARSRVILRVGPFLGLAINVVWGGVSLIFSAEMGQPLGSFLDILALTMTLVGLLCTVRLPSIALQFVLAPIIILVARAVWAADGGFALGITVGMISLVALATAVIALNLNFRRRGILEKSHKRDSEVIKLLLRDLGTEMRDWLWESDSAGRLTFTSIAIENVLGHAAKTFSAERFIDAFFGLHAPDIAAKLQAKAVVADAMLSMSVDGAEKHWQISAKPVFDADGRFSGYRGVSRDMTVQRQHENQTARARDEAQRANEAKSQFLGVISHELRTPINAIVGFSEVLSASQGENLSLVARREYLGTIMESAKHLQGLINDILEATRMERGTLSLDEQPNDAAELVEIAVKIVRDQATTARISLVARVIEDVVLTGDLTRLKQVILNVLTNAIKFSPEGGIVQVDMNRDRESQLIISVRDAGIGISAQDAERVFEPFVQVENGSNRRFGGVGLGLAIARRIARLHGGDLTLSGALGVGTEARLTMPAERVQWPKSASGKRQETVAA